MKAIDEHRASCHLPLGFCRECEYEALAEDLRYHIDEAFKVGKAMADLRRAIRAEQKAT